MDWTGKVLIVTMTICFAVGLAFTCFGLLKYVFGF